MTKIYYEVPYEAGFQQGVNKFNTLDEALAAAKNAYGDVYMITSEQIVANHKPVGPLLNLIKKEK